MSIEPQYPNQPRNGKALAGVILLCIGGVLLLQQLSWFIFPDWVISWPMFFIALGVYFGAKNNFRKPFPIVLIVIGVVNLADDIFPAINIDRVIWPLAIIAFGAWMIMGRRNNKNADKYKNVDFAGQQYANPFDPQPKPAPAANPNFDPNAPAADAGPTYTPPFMGDDHIDTVSVFGGVKRTILSKNFKGGEIVNIFGGTDLDLTQADINGHVIVEITQLFGGIKLIIPPHWQVTSDVAAVFSSVDDKRRNMGVPLSTDKVLVIKGVSIFAGVDIRSF